MEAGFVKRSLAHKIRGRDVCSMGNQPLGHSDVTESARGPKRRVALFGVDGIDVGRTCSMQTFHLLQLTQGAGDEEALVLHVGVVGLARATLALVTLIVIAVAFCVLHASDNVALLILASAARLVVACLTLP